ncbi:hypothetical protein [Pseudomonas gingeri]|uniref:hypothetical protein n=1 Tax=Pseudomonas gingeri TaxID=117681 RepID=UPI0015A27B57|nr:hypothetical protein [Pseudomonas gingeri]NWA11925.1 hypothetical protein [Pseudomonas gingeri]
MRVKNILDRASYDTDAQFERVVDACMKKLPDQEKQKLLFSLMRECRGCGHQPTYKTTAHAARNTRAGFQRYMHCLQCKREVPLTNSDVGSFGRLVTLWNTTPLTIEGKVEKRA